MEQHRGKRRNHFVLKGLLSFALSGYQISGLFVCDLDLLIDDLAGEPVDRQMHPVMLLAFDHEFGKISRTWIVGQGSGISHGLRDYVDKQVPSPRFE